MENEKYGYIKEPKMKLESKNMRNRIKLSFCVLIIVVVIEAYLIANNNILPAFNPTENEGLGISLHSLSANEAQIVNASGAR